MLLVLEAIHSIGDYETPTKDVFIKFAKENKISFDNSGIKLSHCNTCNIGKHIKLLFQVLNQNLVIPSTLFILMFGKPLSFLFWAQILCYVCGQFFEVFMDLSQSFLLSLWIENIFNENLNTFNLMVEKNCK